MRRRRARPPQKPKETRVTNVLSFPHQVTRLVFDVGQPYEKFRGRYEAAVPPANPPRPDGFSWRHAQGPGLAADADEPAPHGFLLYWRADLAPLMTAAGELRPCTAYLMGSHSLVEQIYRRDPAVMLYAPLRTLIYIDATDRTRFAVDQPSTAMAAFGAPAIAELGASLDRELAELLEALGVEASPVFGGCHHSRRMRSALP
jgi:hypothetical protein